MCQCAAAGVKTVSRKAIDTRIALLDPRMVTSRRHGNKATRTAFGPVGGYYDVRNPLEVMQIDHTRVDVNVVSDAVPPDQQALRTELADRHHLIWTFFEGAQPIKPQDDQQ